MTAVRLGRSRFMRGPLGDRWSIFRLTVATVPAEPGSDSNGLSTPTALATRGGVRRFSDVPSAIGAGVVLGALAVASVLFARWLPRPVPAIEAMIAPLVALGVIAFRWFARGRLREQPPSPR